jgi:hypothetical protein
MVATRHMNECLQRVPEKASEFFDRANNAVCTGRK